jgi:hypothetical protein
VYKTDTFATIPHETTYPFEQYGNEGLQEGIDCEKHPQSDSIVDDERCEFAVESGNATIEPPSE